VSNSISPVLVVIIKLRIFSQGVKSQAGDVSTALCLRPSTLALEWVETNFHFAQTDIRLSHDKLASAVVCWFGLCTGER